MITFFVKKIVNLYFLSHSSCQFSQCGGGGHFGSIQFIQDCCTEGQFCANFSNLALLTPLKFHRKIPTEKTNIQILN